MPRPIINGTLQPVRKSVKVSFDPQGGKVITQEYESAGDNCHGLARQMERNGIAYDHTSSAVKSTLVCTSSGAAAGNEEIAIDTWQMLANEQHLDVRESPAFAGLPDSVKAQIEKDLRRSESGKTPLYAYADTEWQSANGATAGDATNADALFQLMRRGTTHLPVGQWVLRHTTNVGANTTTNVSDTDVGLIYSTANLLAEVTNANLWTYPLPTRLRTKIQNISVPAAIAGLTWGWRKLPSTESTVAGNRVDIATEYHLAQWPDIIY